MINTNVQRASETLADGREIILETGKLARQADGSVVLTVGKTMLLATVVSSKTPKDVDFLPLTVDFREKFSAAGKFPGGFLKREARPSDLEILVSRLIDRAIRPLFPKGYSCETQLLVSLISAEEGILPDAYACLAASAALAVSDIPLEKPVSELRVSRLDGNFVINPTIEEQKSCDMNYIVAGTSNDIMMVEGESTEITEHDLISALKFAHENIITLCRLQEKLAEKVDASREKRAFEVEKRDEELYAKVKELAYNELKQHYSTPSSKKERGEKFQILKEKSLETLGGEEEENNELLSQYLGEMKKEVARNTILDTSVRMDGRKLDEIREITCEVDYLPSVHGSAIFTRGETQSLTSVTLGSKKEKQLIDGAVVSGEEKFLLHYNFPPFCTGEAKPIRGVSRREVGHGNLALRALKHVVKESDTQYTIRIVSDILESNGSSSMATVCAGSLALMDAGIKIKKPVAGIAMGLISDGEKYAVLSDILGDEDHLGRYGL